MPAIQSQQSSRPAVSVVTAAVAAAFAFGAAVAEAAPPTKIGKGEGQVDIVAWPRDDVDLPLALADLRGRLRPRDGIG